MDKKYFIKNLKDGLTVKEIAELNDINPRTLITRMHKLGVYAKNIKAEYKDLSGKNFGKLHVVREIQTEKGKRWLCRCECGKEKHYSTTKLKKKKQLSCSYCAGSHSWRGYEEISGAYWTSLKLSAKARKIEFNITVEESWKLFINQNRKCALSGIDIKFCRMFNKPSTGQIQTASLDRIDSSKGYIFGNLQWIYKPLNRMKNSMPENEFIFLCKKITEYQNVKDARISD